MVFLSHFSRKIELKLQKMCLLVIPGTRYIQLCLDLQLKL